MNNFKEKRNELNLSRKYVSEHLNVSMVSVWYWENNERNPRYDMLIKLAKLYDCTIDELVEKAK